MQKCRANGEERQQGEIADTCLPVILFTGVCQWFLRSLQGDFPDFLHGKMAMSMYLYNHYVIGHVTFLTRKVYACQLQRDK